MGSNQHTALHCTALFSPDLLGLVMPCPCPAMGGRSRDAVREDREPRIRSFIRLRVVRDIGRLPLREREMEMEREREMVNEREGESEERGSEAIM
jgi:hypothetical protein